MLTSAQENSQVPRVVPPNPAPLALPQGLPSHCTKAGIIPLRERGAGGRPVSAASSIQGLGAPSQPPSR